MLIHFLLFNARYILINPLMSCILSIFLLFLFWTSLILLLIHLLYVFIHTINFLIGILCHFETNQCLCFPHKSFSVLFQCYSLSYSFDCFWNSNLWSKHQYHQVLYLNKNRMELIHLLLRGCLSVLFLLDCFLCFLSYL